MAVLGQYVIAAAITAQQSTSDVTSDLRRPTDHVISLRAVIGCNKIASCVHSAFTRVSPEDFDFLLLLSLVKSYIMPLLHVK